jgi:hypothetical protein
MCRNSNPIILRTKFFTEAMKKKMVAECFVNLWRYFEKNVGNIKSMNVGMSNYN